MCDVQVPLVTTPFWETLAHSAQGPSGKQSLTPVFWQATAWASVTCHHVGHKRLLQTTCSHWAQQL